jgi:hypothetical protein
MLSPCVERYVVRMRNTQESWNGACVRHFQSKTEANKLACENALAEHKFNQCAAWWMDLHESDVQPTRLYYLHQDLISDDVKVLMHAHSFMSIGDKATEFLDKHDFFHVDPSDKNALGCAMSPVGKAAMEDLKRDNLLSVFLESSVNNFAAFLEECSE